VEYRSEEGDRPVDESMEALWSETRVLRDLGKPVGICVDRHVRLNISWRPIVKQYREGKVKSMPMRQVKENLKPCACKQSEGYAMSPDVECLMACL
jgi:hypothetical protein